MAVAFCLCLARSTHPSQRFSFWAEDGAIFTTQVRARGIVHSFFLTYDGYYHFLPRAVASVASVLPLRWSPPLYSVFAMVLASTVAAMAYRAARVAFRLSYLGAAVLSASVLLLPASGAETFSTLTSVEWYCLAGLVVYLAAWLEGWQTQPVVTGCLLFVAAATTPLAGLTLPFIAVGVLWQRRRSALDLAVVLGVLAGVAVEVIGHLRAPPGQPVPPVHIVALAALYLVRVVDGSLPGDRLIPVIFHTLGGHLCVAIGCLGLASLVVAACFHPRRWTALLLILTSVLLFATSGAVRGLSEMENFGFPQGSPTGPTSGGRYYAVPALCLVMALLLILRRPMTQGPRDDRPSWSGLTDTTNPLRDRPPTVVVNLALVVALAFNLPLNLYRQPLRTWEQAISAAHATCEAQHDRAKVIVANAPSAGFGIRLTCHEAFGNS